jgi:hypothetical protein
VSLETAEAGVIGIDSFVIGGGLRVCAAPTPLNPLGVKGAGEAGIAAAGAAIAAAVDDALGRVSAVRQLPITPWQRRNSPRLSDRGSGQQRMEVAEPKVC